MSMLFKRIKDWVTSITAFRTGDVIPVDGPSGTAKMSKDDLLRETAENALGSIHSLSTTATEADLGAGNYIPLDGSAGTKKMPTFYMERYNKFFKFLPKTKANLLDTERAVFGYYLLSDGTLAHAVSDQYYVSDYIPTFGNNIVGDFGGTKDLVAYSVYDKDLNHIRSVFGTTEKYECQSESEAYIRGFFRVAAGDVMVNYGNDILPYAEYEDDLQFTQKKVDDLEISIGDCSDILDSNSVLGDEKFSSFQTRKPSSKGTNFKGFATRYSYSGFVGGFGVSGNFSNLNGDDVHARLEIRKDSFNGSVLAYKDFVVGDNTRYVSMFFEKPVVLDGNFFVVVSVSGANDRFTIANEDSGISTATSDKKNLYKTTNGTWSVIVNTGYNIDLQLFDIGIKSVPVVPSNIIYIGNKKGCKYTDVQAALEAINDDSESNPYTFIVCEGTYPRFSMRTKNRVRWISVIGLDVTKTKFFDNRGNYWLSPSEIWTNGTIENLTFANITDQEHYSQHEGRTASYAVHIDFGTCKTIFRNCVMITNGGPAVGIGLWKEETLEFHDCRFESLCDGTYGSLGRGSFYCHTAVHPGEIANDQKLVVHNCIGTAIEAVGAQLSIPSTGTEGTHVMELANTGFFGSGGANCFIGSGIVLSPYNFGNVPSTLNNN